MVLTVEPGCTSPRRSRRARCLARHRRAHRGRRAHHGPRPRPAHGRSAARAGGNRGPDAVKSDQHVLIAGGGMVGLSLALLLDRQLPSGVRITLVEGTALPSAPDTGAAYHPSFDARSTALSYSTASIYRRLGVWDVLRPGLAPIESIHVSRRARPAARASSPLNRAGMPWAGWSRTPAWAGLCSPRSGSGRASPCAARRG
jgi:hypothetical protein